MLLAEEPGTAEGRMAVSNATARSVFVIGPHKSIKRMMAYPMTPGRNFDEMPRAVDSMQMTAMQKVAQALRADRPPAVLAVGQGVAPPVPVCFLGRKMKITALLLAIVVAGFAVVPVFWIFGDQYPLLLVHPGH